MSNFLVPSAIPWRPTPKRRKTSATDTARENVSLPTCGDQYSAPHSPSNNEGGEGRGGEGENFSRSRKTEPALGNWPKLPRSSRQIVIPPYVNVRIRLGSDHPKKRQLPTIYLIRRYRAENGTNFSFLINYKRSSLLFTL